MILTPASTRSSARPCAAAVGTAEHADDDVLLLDDRTQLVVVAHDVLADPLADLRRIGVEDRHDAEAVVGEDVRGGDRLAEVPGAEQRDVVLAGGPQDLADLRDERVDVVAHAALAELAEAREVAADLRRVDVRVVGELLRGDRLAAHLARLRQHLQVARQARRDAERQPLGRNRGVLGVAGRFAVGHRADSSEPVPQNRLIDREVEQLLAVERDHRNPLEVGAQQRVVALDVSLEQLERLLGAHPLEHRARVVAQAAPGAAVEHDDAHRSGPSPVA